eukprot:gene10703-12404_t
MASDYTGTDGDKNYNNPQELWQQQQDADGSHNTWYQKAVSYWDDQEATYDGVLGGFGYVSDVDVVDSRQLLQKTQLEAAAAGQRTLVALGVMRPIARGSSSGQVHLFAITVELV